MCLIQMPAFHVFGRLLLVVPEASTGVLPRVQDLVIELGSLQML